MPTDMKALLRNALCELINRGLVEIVDGKALPLRSLTTFCPTTNGYLSAIQRIFRSSLEHVLPGFRQSDGKMATHGA